ncbi:protein peste-like [Bombyx mandarina]|uniref:Cameo2 n=4 Tax=Bombyx TaxID=7090 RepID=D2KXB3_BOMMO|nr:scavenger receptor class B member 4 [Bombyx mori]XP_028030781.1 protein peste-like [Bombyx mandarina]BAI66272.1 Cameo2 [Bombyx mori]
MRGGLLRWRSLWICGGALLALSAFVAALTWGAIFDSAFGSQLALIPDSRSFMRWLEPDVPIFFDIYMFNWTNPERFPEEKPNFEEIGPYRYQEHRRHVNISWHPENGTIGYRTLRSWVWDESSVGSQDDIITTIDVITASAIYQARFSGFIEQKLVSLTLTSSQHTKVSVTARASEFLFEGYEDPLLNLAKLMPASVRGGAPALDRFGWFFSRNNTDTDGYMEVTSGTRDGLPGQILRWNYQDHIPFYDGECSKLSGSAGEYIPRNLTEDSKLTMYVPDLCRTVNMEFVESGVQNGLKYNKYEVNERSFDNSSTSPENTCFCKGECAWGGVMNVSACRFGSPAFITLPHFLHGDPALLDQVTGMNPDPDKHSFYFAVEPKLGVPIDVAGRFQFNVYVEPSDHITLYENMPRMLFPVFWVEQKAKIDPKIISELRTVRGILDWGPTFCACFAVVIALLVTAITCCTKRTEYTRPHDLLKPYEKPKDEAEMKLNPI